MDTLTSTAEKTFSIFDEVNETWLYDYASSGQRFLNFLIDSVILNRVFSMIAGFFIGLVMVLSGNNPRDFEIFINPFYSWLFNYGVGSVCLVLYYTITEGASGGRTLGKLITITEAINEDGSEMAFRDAFKRSLCRVVPFEPFSALGSFPWHDRWTRTVVVKRKFKSAV